MNNRHTPLLLLSGLLFGCTSPQAEQNGIQLNLVQSIDQLADSSYFCDVRCMDQAGGEILFLDTKRCQIIRIDTTLKYQGTIGALGHAANELADVYQFTTNNQEVICDDGASLTFKVFDMLGNFSHSIAPYNPDFNPGSARFAYENHKLYLSGVHAQYPLMVYDTSTDSSILFGENYHFDSPKQTRIRNSRFVTLTAPNIIAVSNNVPRIEIFDKQSLKLLQSYDYSKIPIVDKTIRAIGTNAPKENSYTTLVSDIYLYNHTLFLLFNTYSPEYRVNTILSFEMTDRDLTPQYMYTMPGKCYGSFCVTESGIYAFNITENTIEKLVMPKENE